MAPLKIRGHTGTQQPQGNSTFLNWQATAWAVMLVPFLTAIRMVAWLPAGRNQHRTPVRNDRVERADDREISRILGRQL